MTLSEYLDEAYANRKDKDNIFGVGIDDRMFRVFVIQYLLGDDWYVTDPLGQNQINEIALEEILTKYSKKYRKEVNDKKRRITVDYDNDGNKYIHIRMD